MKRKIASLLKDTLDGLSTKGEFRGPTEVDLTRPRQDGHGDFASNVALAAAKAMGVAPRALAERIRAAIPPSRLIERVEVAGPGFLNFFVSAGAWRDIVPEILGQGDTFGYLPANGKRVLLEFVSANPNGPLHVGHGRGAAYGDSLARLMTSAGYTVEREYYVNDAGRQMDILALSVWARYMEACGQPVAFPANGYRGDYVHDIARHLKEAAGDSLIRPDDAPVTGDDIEAITDARIAHLKAALGPLYGTLHGTGLKAMLADIREDLEEFGVRYDRWYSERSLVESGAIKRALALLAAHGDLYEKDGAHWFRATRYGDEKDRVVVRENAVPTYFASDIAYHLEKYERGYDHLINIWGADHHGYIPRVKGAVTAMGRDPARLEILLVQFAILYRGGQRAQMSTRSGDFVTLRELRKEVGNDAARFFYVLRKSEQHMDFDLDLAKSRSNENPVFYVQYAHARIVSVFRQMRERGQTMAEPGASDLGLLTAGEELALLRALNQYTQVIEEAAETREPHQLAYYLRELASLLHAYYNAQAFLSAEDPLRQARLTLLLAVRQVLANGLMVLGVSAPEAM
ncbi:MAG: arginine--tRNA ligase [Gammaproteobacteria bacterium]|nr:arginine--tRNA ligase [Gammaproteobacteria bacterium]